MLPVIAALTVAFVTLKRSLTFAKIGWVDELRIAAPDGGSTLNCKMPVPERAIELYAFRRPPVIVLPLNAGIGTTPPRMRPRNSSRSAPGYWLKIKAATPTTCGVAMLVPSKSW